MALGVGYGFQSIRFTQSVGAHDGTKYVHYRQESFQSIRFTQSVGDFVQQCSALLDLYGFPINPIYPIGRGLPLQAGAQLPAGKSFQSIRFTQSVGVRSSALEGRVRTVSNQSDLPNR